MKFFYQSKKIDQQKVFEATQKAYGVKNPASISGYYGTFLFSLGDIYVSEGLYETILNDTSLSDFLINIIDQFLKNDYGDVSSEEENENLANRYLFGNFSDMVGRYISRYGTITLKTFQEYTLLELATETTAPPSI